jgi:hypothetical protein
MIYDNTNKFLGYNSNEIYAYEGIGVLEEIDISYPTVTSLPTVVYAQTVDVLCVVLSYQGRKVFHLCTCG